MPYRYHCHACHTESELCSWPGQARAVRREHRRIAHGGMRPAAGDRIAHATPSVRGPAWTAGVLLALIVLRELTGIEPADIARALGLL